MVRNDDGLAISFHSYLYLSRRLMYLVYSSATWLVQHVWVSIEFGQSILTNYYSKNTWTSGFERCITRSCSSHDEYLITDSHSPCLGRRICSSESVSLLANVFSGPISPKNKHSHSQIKLNKNTKSESASPFSSRKKEHPINGSAYDSITFILRGQLANSRQVIF